MQIGSSRDAAVLAAAIALLTVAPAAIAGASTTSNIYLSLKADHERIEPGDPVQISWASSGARECVASGNWRGPKPVDGWRDFTPTAPASYTLTCSNASGAVSDTVAVSIAGLPELDLAATPDTLAEGESTRIHWTSENVGDCVASGDWRGPKPVEGWREFAPDTARSYTLTCEGPKGSVSRTVEVAMAAPEPEVEAPVAEVDPDAPVLELSATPEALEDGQTTRIHWTSDKVTDCVASGDWRGSKPVEGWREFTPDTARSYTLTCDGPYGTVSQTVAVAMAADAPLVEVAAPVEEPEPYSGPTLELLATPPLVEVGDSTRISWTSAGVTDCVASGDWRGSKPVGGWREFTPSTPRSYTLTCSGPQGNVSDTVDVGVLSGISSPEIADADTPPASEQPAEPIEESPPVEPSVSLAAAATVVDRGASTQLVWDSDGAESCSADGAWQGDKPIDGEQSIGPIDRSSTYSLTCSGEGGNAVAMISVAINDTVTLNWQAPSQNTDGSTLTDLAGYRIYYGTDSGDYTASMEVGLPGANTRAVKLTSGSYYFAMTAVNVNGDESPYSNEIARTVE